MKQLRHVLALLNDNLSVRVYSDVIPEAETNTAASLAHLGSISSRLNVNGSKSGNQSNWRVTVVSEDDAELESVIDELGLLDNRKFTGFQKVFIDNVTLEPRGYSEPFKRAFITLRTYV